MNIVKLKGGLGNQMFQYSFAKLLQYKTDTDTFIDLSAYNVESKDEIRKPRILKFNISLPEASSKELTIACRFDHSDYSMGIWYKFKILLEILTNRKYLFERNMIPKDIEKYNNYIYFDGYWQSWKYVDEIFNEIKKDFLPKSPLSVLTKKTVDEVRAVQSVFVGIRRGDYLKEKDLYGEFGVDYYLAAMEHIEKKLDNPIYYVFSNDIDWVEQNMDFGDRKIVYRRNEDVVDDFEELILMSNCRHSIIQNSTFHWWGARLNYYDGKIVVAPEKWFYDGTKIDIIPPEWVKIENPQ